MHDIWQTIHLHIHVKYFQILIASLFIESCDKNCRIVYAYILYEYIGIGVHDVFVYLIYIYFIILYFYRGESSFYIMPAKKVGEDTLTN